MKIIPFDLERYFSKYEFNVPYLLCSSDCETMTLGELLSYETEMQEQFLQYGLGYTESQGDLELRAAIAQLYESITPEQVLVCTGAEEGIFLFMTAIFNPGDHIIVHAPCFQSLTAVAQAAGCEVTLWRSDPANGWELDLNELEDQINPRTRAVVLNSPHNPTGYIISPVLYDELIALLNRHNLWLFSDEVYRYLEHDPAYVRSPACDLYPNAVSLGVMSKAFGLGGLRVGWVATQNREIYQSMLQQKDYTTICGSAPSQFLAIAALKYREKILTRNRNIVARNLQFLDTFFDRHPNLFRWWHPKGSSVAFPEWLGSVSTEEFCTDLAAREGVMLLPGHVYHSDYRQYLRFGYARENLPEALERLEKYLDYSFPGISEGHHR